MVKWVTFDTSVKATGSITIVDLGSDTTNINHLHGTTGFTITDTEGTAVEYIFDKNDALGVTGTVHSDGTVIQVNGFTAATLTAAEVVKAIESDGGHAGSIICNRADNVITLTQEEVGSSGNVTIAPGSMPTPSYITFSGLSGGVLGKYVYRIENINSIHLISGTVIKFYVRNPNQPTEAVSDDIITITCATDTASTIFTHIVKQITSENVEAIFSALSDVNITTVAYAAGS